MDKKTYADKLKDPRWQKKRLEILNRDEWSCLTCGTGDETLHVHHLYYLPNVEPWEYPSEAYRTLCAECHEAEKDRAPAERHLLHMLRRAGMSLEEIVVLARMVNELHEGRFEKLIITRDDDPMSKIEGDNSEPVYRIHAALEW